MSERSHNSDKRGTYLPPHKRGGRGRGRGGNDDNPGVTKNGERGKFIPKWRRRDEEGTDKNKEGSEAGPSGTSRNEDSNRRGGGGSWRGRGRGDNRGGGRGGRYHPTTPLDRNKFSRRDNNNGNGNHGSETTTASSRPPVFGYRRIERLLTEEDMNQVVESIYKDKEEWVLFLNSDKVVAESQNVVVHMVIHLLSKMCTEKVSVLQDQNVVFIATLTAKKFWERVKEKTKKLVFSHDDIPNGMERNIVDTSIRAFLSDIHTICDFLLDRAKESATDCLKDIADEGWNSAIKLRRLGKIGEEMESQFETLMKKFDAVERKAQMQKHVMKELFNKRGEFTEDDQEMFDQMDMGDQFKQVSVVPTMGEIKGFSWRKNLRPNKEKGKFVNGEHYLDVQFRLLREDFLFPLRKAVREFLDHEIDYTSGRKKPAIDKVRLYTPIYIHSREVRRNASHYWLQLPERMGKIKWDKSKRLLNGSLLVLTSDGFKSAYFGVVGDRDPEVLKKERMISFIPEGDHPPYGTQEGFVMIESEVYFEAYRHVLKTLQTINLDSFPMSKFIVSASHDVGIPKYLHDEDGEEETKELVIHLPPKTPEEEEKQLARLLQHVNPDQEERMRDALKKTVVTHSVHPDDEEEWPTSESLGLDTNQYSAFKAALTKEFSIIQGPPGTGKTYLGLRIAEVFLKNTELWRPQGTGPLVVVCYTNHALDQFLEGIDKIGKKNLSEIEKRMQPPVSIVRLGGRCTSDELKKYEIGTVRRKDTWWKGFVSHDMRGERWSAEAVVEHLEEEIVTQTQIAEHLDAQKLQGIVDFRFLPIWDELHLEFPSSVWVCLSNPKFFGINEHMIGEKEYDVKAVIGNYFRDSQAQAPIVRHGRDGVQNTNGYENDNDLKEGEEDEYDMMELMEHRIIEEQDYRRKALRGSWGDKPALVFVDRLSVWQCKKILTDLGVEIKNLVVSTKDPENPDREKHWKKLQSLRAEERTWTRKLHFLLSVLERVKESHGISMLEIEEKIEDLMSEDTVENCRRVFRDIPSRWYLLLYVAKRVREMLLEKVNRNEALLQTESKRLQELKDHVDVQILKHADVVGMTTTGAAKYRHILQNLESKIVIVEEAAEILEAHIVGCLTKYTQHVILIGDHLQLKPNAVVFELCKKYKLNVSLFERMINNDLSCHPLRVQHRMRPEISDLVRGTVYDVLDDDVSVIDRKNIAGMKKNLFFFTHDHKEQSEAEGRSKSNEFEADFFTGLCRYLLLQGYEPCQITVLCTYTGQMFLVKKKFRDNSQLRYVRVTCVDNFQGEENDIILLSLVRSNDDGKIGFLNVDNRVCVALSRARDGLYIVGNMDILSDNSKIWPQIRRKFENRQEIGKTIEIVCSVHGTVQEIQNGIEFRLKAPEGGCQNTCGFHLKCNHKCTRLCHLDDRAHEKYKCNEFCERTTCIEEQKHPCRMKCWQTCIPCPERVPITLPCGHRLMVACHTKNKQHICYHPVDKELRCGHVSKNQPCHLDPDRIDCEVVVDKYPPCNKHLTSMMCHKDPNDYKCLVEEEKILPCNHTKTLKCHVDETQERCRVRVMKLLPCKHEQEEECFQNQDSVGCLTPVQKKMAVCEHEMTVPCKDKNAINLFCSKACTTRLDCGHACRKLCHVFEDPDHLEYLCRKQCEKACNNSHSCSLKHQCHEDCPPCSVKMEKILTCGHSATIPCHLDPANYKGCRRPCERVLDCAHRCKNVCGVSCGPCMVPKQHFIIECSHSIEKPCSYKPKQSDCVTMVKSDITSPCGHVVEIPCRRKKTLSREEIQQLCKVKCNYVFPEEEGGCGHVCAGTCGDCRGSAFHKKCNKKCERNLICGHICKFPCATQCPPCREKCIMKCEHSQCKKECGKPCTECKEPCQWKCPHARCSRKCGEDCDREPCNEACPKVLKCSHPCVGFCGEPCPPLCPTCDREQLQGMQIPYFDIDENSRFVYLPDCGHSIESECLEMYMRVKNSDEVGVKRCPSCNVPIRQCRRFGNILRETIRDVRQVMGKIFGNQKELKKGQNELISRTRSKKWFHVPKDVAAKLQGLLFELVPQKKNQYMSKYEKRTILTERPKPIDGKILNSLRALFPLVERGSEAAYSNEERLVHDPTHTGISARIPDEQKNSLKLFAKRLFDEIVHKRELPLSTIEIRDVTREFMRLLHLRQLYRFSSYSQPNVKSVYEPLQTNMESCHAYEEQLQQNCLAELKKLADVCRTGLGITETERIEIVRAIGLNSGHWFKCPNGHIYAIGDCGGANQVSRCNECGAQIGGTSHQLLQGNQLAREMDGASAPAWPTALIRL